MRIPALCSYYTWAYLAQHSMEKTAIWHFSAERILQPLPENQGSGGQRAQRWAPHANAAWDAPAGRDRESIAQLPSALTAPREPRGPHSHSLHPLALGRGGGDGLLLLLFLGRLGRVRG